MRCVARPRKARAGTLLQPWQADHEKRQFDWTRNTEADFARGTTTVARAKTYGTACLLPEFALDEDVREWVEEHAW
jgi:hypothetical protein